MSSPARIVILLLLLAALIQGVALFLPPQFLVTLPGYQYLWLNEGQQSAAAADYLDRMYRGRFYYETKALEDNGWSLRYVRPDQDVLKVVINFSSQDSHVPPIYRELVRFCPVDGVDGYWEKRFARPIRLYLAKRGGSSVRSMAYCGPEFDEQAFERISNMSFSGPELEILPHVGDDIAALEAAVEAGNPSYTQARNAMHPFNEKLLLDYLDRRPGLALMYDRQGHTLMHAAASGVAVKSLLAFGANPNVQERDGPSLLSWMAQRGHCDALRQLFYEGMANAAYADPEFAATTECADLLLDNGAPIRDNAVYEALDSGRLEIARLLDERGGDINRTTLASPLHYFAQQAHKYGSDEAVEKFVVALELGADTRRRDRGVTIVQWMQQQGDFAGRYRMLVALKRAVAREQK